jgi:6-phosphogluconate dehydrogenase
MPSVLGVVGLGVMGRHLALNAAGKGFAVAGFDLDAARVRSLIEAAGGARREIAGAESPRHLVQMLERPRRILVMVPAGAVDGAIAHLEPQLERGDILIDGGNSYFLDTERRSRALGPRGIHLVGLGVSGGEQGALHGPSLMPGGPPEAWDAVAPILTAMAARAEDGEPCVAYMGPRGAGHYVKMVHNGIEYADMQLIAEVFDLLHRGLGVPAADLAGVFAEWNRGELRSYLVEITAAILATRDPDSGLPLVDVIRDEAEQKGTGRWVCQNALDVGAPIPTIDAAVVSRILSSLGAERAAAHRVLRGPAGRFDGSRDGLIEAARDALYASKITAYAQGLALLRLASEEYQYGLDPGAVARIWRAGCIIRAAVLGDIAAAYRRTPGLVNLLVDAHLAEAVVRRQAAWRVVVRTAVGLGIPALALGSSLAYFDAYRSERLPASLTQAQRDYFGAHGYRRIDREGAFHTRWTDERAQGGAR